MISNISSATMKQRLEQVIILVWAFLLLLGKMSILLCTIKGMKKQLVLNPSSLLLLENSSNWPMVQKFHRSLIQTVKHHRIHHLKILFFTIPSNRQTSFSDALRVKANINFTFQKLVSTYLWICRQTPVRFPHFGPHCFLQVEMSPYCPCPFSFLIFKTNTSIISSSRPSVFMSLHHQLYQLYKCW